MSTYTTKQKWEFSSPHERSLLSLGFKDPRLLSEIRSHITIDYFLRDPHKVIFGAMCTLYEEVTQLDYDTLRLKCRELGLDESIPDAYLLGIASGGFPETSLQLYLKEVRQAYVDYRTSKAIEAAYQKLNNPAPDEDSKDIVDDLTRQLNEIEAFRGFNSNLLDVREVIRDYVIEHAENPELGVGLPTGFPLLDFKINGMNPGELIIVGATTKGGKSTFLMNVAHNITLESDVFTANKQRGSVLFLSTEMYTKEDSFRKLAIVSGVRERRIRTGEAWKDPEEKAILEAALAKIEDSEYGVFHEYLPKSLRSFKTEDVISRIRYYAEKIPNLKLIIYDYIKLPPGNSLRDMKEYQSLGVFANALKELAGQLELPILTACQLNRSNDVASSFELIWFCNTYLLLRRQKLEEIQEHGNFKEHGTHVIEVKRTRAGGSGKVPIKFFEPCLTMLEAKPFESSEDQTEPDKGRLLLTPREMEQEVQTRYTDAYENLPQHLPSSGSAPAVSAFLHNQTQSQLSPEEVLACIHEQASNGQTNQ